MGVMESMPRVRTVSINGFLLDMSSSGAISEGFDRASRLAGEQAWRLGVPRDTTLLRDVVRAVLDHLA